ncbi:MULTISPECIES: hypothetical protein [Pseudomonadaceae]|nr:MULTISPECIES: hypothetical protein [Pseudomonadaceae]
MQKIIADTLAAQKEFMDEAEAAIGGGRTFSTLVQSLLTYEALRR